jgi:Anti-sigma-K factor rskA, C-terminal
VNATEHPVDELPALLHGELRLDEVRTVTTHLRSCASCQRELVEIATGFGAVTRMQRQGLIDAVPPVLPPLGELPADAEADDGESDGKGDARNSDGRRVRWLVPVAAAVVALVAMAGAVLLTRDGSSSPTGPVAQVALTPVSDQSAAGKVKMSGTGPSRAMVVSTNLPPASTDHYYEVWLLDTRTNGMVAVGVLPASGTAHFTIPEELVSRYDAVDLSLQDDNGNPTHSQRSVLRARYA